MSVIVRDVSKRMAKTMFCATCPSRLTLGLWLGFRG